MSRLLRRLAPPLALMALIFVLSAQPSLSTGLGVWDVVLRKAAHMVEFGLLWWLWWRALGFRRAGLAVAITLAYAATDELHQTTVPGRDGSFWDWAIDAAGVGLAGALAWRYSRLARCQATSSRAARPSPPAGGQCDGTAARRR